MSPVTLRTRFTDADLSEVRRMHGDIYAREQGFDATFEEHVTGPLAAFAKAPTARERLWIAERDGRIVGSIAIVDAGADVAQLRWFLVDPSARGAGLGRRLIDESLSFSRSCAYRSVMLWTVSPLHAAAHLYVEAGFRLVEENPCTRWGVELAEQRYELSLTA